MSERLTLTIRINKNSIFYFLIIIPFIPLNYVSEILSGWSLFCTYARILVIVILLFRLIVISRHIKETLVLALLFFAAGLLSTLIAGGSFYTLLLYSTYLFGFTLMIEDGVFFDIDALISGWLLWFEILIYVNLIFYFLFPDGYQEKYYFFGNYNTTIRKLFPGIILGCVHAFRVKNRVTIRFCCMYAALLYFLIRVGSMTAMFGMVIFAVAILYFMLRKKSGIFKLEYFFIISIIATLAIAVFGRFNLFERFITVILGKDMTLSNRTVIWARSIQAIAKRPIWGYGQLDRSAARALLGAEDPHNIFLGILFYGGIIGMVVLVVILLAVLRKLREARKITPSFAMIFDAGFCAYFVMWNFEPFANIDEFYKIFAFFVMAYYCINFAKGVKKKDSG